MPTDERAEQEDADSPRSHREQVESLKAPGLEVFVVAHDQGTILEYEAYSRYRNLGAFRYLFVGNGDTDRVRHRDDVIVVRSLPDNIENYPNLLSFTAWYAVARNRLVGSPTVAILEYDVEVSPDFVSRTTAELEAGHSVVGYVPFPLSHPMYLHATPWFEAALQSAYGIDPGQMVSNHLASGNADRWTATTNLAMRRSDLVAFVDWFLPLTTMFREEPIGAHVHERAVPIYCMLHGIENTYIAGVLDHTQARSHGILAVSQDEARRLAEQSKPLLPPGNKP